MSFYDKSKKVRLRLCMDPKERFPEKLHEVANDNFLVKWSHSGESVTVVDPETFEENIMKCYPGFLQIASFVNFRRLFREYGFDWKIHNDGTMEFSHEFFIRNQPQLLEEIVTRRKSFYRVPRVPKTPSEPSTPLGKRRSSLRRTVLESSKTVPRDVSPISIPDSPCESRLEAIVKEQARQIVSELRLSNTRRKLDPALLDTVVRNELTDDDVIAILERRSNIVDRIEQPKTDNLKPKAGYEWLYMFWELTDVDVDVFGPTWDTGTNVLTDSRLMEGSEMSESGRMVKSPCCPCVCHVD